MPTVLTNEPELIAKGPRNASSVALDAAHSYRQLNEIRSRLGAQPYRPLRNVAVDYRNGVVTLRGVLPSYYLKQVAQCVVQRVAGIRRIDNFVEVKSSFPIVRPAIASRINTPAAC
jgi:hypothetical protein